MNTIQHVSNVTIGFSFHHFTDKEKETYVTLLFILELIIQLTS